MISAPIRYGHRADQMQVEEPKASESDRMHTVLFWDFGPSFRQVQWLTLVQGA